MNNKFTIEQLSQLNNDINDSILCRKFTELEFGTLEDCGFDLTNYEQFLENIIFSKKIYRPQTSPISSIVSGKQGDMFKHIIKFMKNFDKELYVQTLSIILHTNPMIDLHLYNYYDVEDYDEMDKNGFYTYLPVPECDLKSPTKHIYLPLHANLLLEESDIIRATNNDSGAFTSRDMIALLHEISHTFDENRNYLHLTHNHNNKISKQLIRDSIIDIKKPSIVHNSETYSAPKEPVAKEVLGETTAITMETLFIEYLVNNSNIPNDDLYNWMRFRINDSYRGTVNAYSKISLSTIKEQKGYIIQKDIDEIQRNHNLSDQQLIQFLSFIHKNPFFRNDRRYANAGFLVPTIIKRLHESNNPSSDFKNYCNFIKEDDIQSALLTFGIDLKSETSKKELISNMLEFEKKWYLVPEKKKPQKNNEQLEK